MKVSCEILTQGALKCDLLCLPVFEDDKNSSTVKMVDKLLGGQIASLYQSKHFTAKATEQHMQVVFPKKGFGQLLLLGMGKKDEFTVERLRRAAGLAGGRATIPQVKTVKFILPDLKTIKGPVAAVAGKAVAEGVNLGSFFNEKFKSKDSERSKPASLTILAKSQSDLKNVAGAARDGLMTSDLQNICRELAFSPANVMTPTRLATEARRIGKQSGLSVQVYGRKQIEKFKMGAFLAVAQGSVEPPQFIKIEYKPRTNAKKRIALIGKGITFDTGGITLKPGADMFEMKQDMTGAAVVICTMAAIAKLKPSVSVTAYIPTCENMPGGRAYKPGDVLTTCIGKTIEVISTDAEGRLLLADALGHASRTKPDFMIDVATLTGAVIVALGHAGAAMMSTSRELVEKMYAASEVTGEKVWQLPLWEDYEHQLGSPIADMKNAFGRPAGSITAALMLKKFTSDIPWLHLDIAGMDLEYRGTEYTPKGASGYGVRLLTELLSNF